MAAEIAQRYAQGLFELARENGTIEAKKEQAEQLLRAFRENPDVNILLRAVKITKEEKKNFIMAVFSKAADGDMIRLMKLMVDKGRVYYMQKTLEDFVRLAEDSMGIEHAVVLSARPLREADLTRIRNALQAKHGKKIVLENRVDPSVIAGIKVTVGSNVTDATMKNRIDSMRETLLKGGQA